MAETSSTTIKRTAGYSADLAEQFLILRNDKVLTDFTIKLQDRSIPCHRVLLAATSPVLKALLTADMAEAALQEVKLEHISGAVMEGILDYMYCGEVTMPNHLLMETIKAGDYLQLKELKQLCAKQVPGNLKPSNVISWFTIGQQMNLSDIHAKCVELISSSFQEVCKEEEFLQLSFAELRDYVNDLQSKEIPNKDLLEATLLWVNHDHIHRSENTEDLLELIILEKCPKKVLKRAVREYGSWLEKRPAACVMLLKVISADSDEETETADEDNSEEHAVIAVVGGSEGDTVNKSCVFINCDTSNQLTEFARLPDDCKKWHSICKTPNSIVVTGGDQSDLCYEFTISSKSWSTLPVMPVKKCYHASVYWKSRILTIAGYVSGSTSPRVDYFDMESRQWKKGPSLPIAVKYPQAACLDESVYVLDGESHKLFQLNTEGTQWVNRAPLPGNNNNDWVSMTAVDGRLHVAGRYGLTGIFATYTPSTDSWVTAQPPLQEHWHGTLVHLSRKLYLIGGLSAMIEEYNEDSGSWSVSDLKLPMKLRFHQAFVLDGRLLQ